MRVCCPTVMSVGCVTLDALRGAAEQADEAVKRKLLDSLDEFGPTIDDPPPEPPLGGG